MPKIKDLGVTTLAFGPEREGARGRGYWLCGQTCVPNALTKQRDEPCNPTPPQCHPTPKCDPTEPEKKYARGVPHHAVAQIKQQMQQISRQLHN
jgi:hypothetical protein